MKKRMIALLLCSSFALSIVSPTCFSENSDLPFASLEPEKEELIEPIQFPNSEDDAIVDGEETLENSEDDTSQEQITEPSKKNADNPAIEEDPSEEVSGTEGTPPEEATSELVWLKENCEATKLAYCYRWSFADGEPLNSIIGDGFAANQLLLKDEREPHIQDGKLLLENSLSFNLLRPVMLDTEKDWSACWHGAVFTGGSEEMVLLSGEQFSFSLSQCEDKWRLVYTFNTDTKNSTVLSVFPVIHDEDSSDWYLYYSAEEQTLHGAYVTSQQGTQFFSCELKWEGAVQITNVFQQLSGSISDFYLASDAVFIQPEADNSATEEEAETLPPEEISDSSDTSLEENHNEETAEQDETLIDESPEQAEEPETGSLEILCCFSDDDHEEYCLSLRVHSGDKANEWKEISLSRDTPSHLLENIPYGTVIDICHETEAHPIQPVQQVELVENGYYSIVFSKELEETGIRYHSNSDAQVKTDAVPPPDIIPWAISPLSDEPDEPAEEPEYLLDMGVTTDGQSAMVLLLISALTVVLFHGKNSKKTSKEDD